MKIRHREAAPMADLVLQDDTSAPADARPVATLDDLVEAETLTTPFEDWCESTGTHPEAPGAWEYFTRHSAAS